MRTQNAYPLCGLSHVHTKRSQSTLDFFAGISANSPLVEIPVIIYCTWIESQCHSPSATRSEMGTCRANADPSGVLALYVRGLPAIRIIVRNHVCNIMFTLILYSIILRRLIWVQCVQCPDSSGTYWHVPERGRVRVQIAGSGMRMAGANRPCSRAHGAGKRRALEGAVCGRAGVEG